MIVGCVRAVNFFITSPRRSIWPRHKPVASWSKLSTPCATSTRTGFATEISSLKTSCCTRRMMIRISSWSTSALPREWTPTRLWTSQTEHHTILRQRFWRVVTRLSATCGPWASLCILCCAESHPLEAKQIKISLIMCSTGNSKWTATFGLKWVMMQKI